MHKPTYTKMGLSSSKAWPKRFKMLKILVHSCVLQVTRYYLVNATMAALDAKEEEYFTWRAPSYTELTRELLRASGGRPCHALIPRCIGTFAWNTTQENHGLWTCLSKCPLHFTLAYVEAPLAMPWLCVEA